MKVSDVDLDDFTVELHQAPSKDGVQVPFTIMYTKGTKFDGTNPALLSFFGFFRLLLITFCNLLQVTCDSPQSHINKGQQVWSRGDHRKRLLGGSLLSFPFPLSLARGGFHECRPVMAQG